MKKWWTRLCCLLLAILMLASVALPVFAAEGEGETAQKDVTKDYVILLDCSLSTSMNDTKNLCLQACWNFLDKLPLYDTRVSIIAFGYEMKKDPGYCDFDSFEVNSKKDMALLHELVPLSELTSSAARDEYKLLVQRALEEFRYDSDSTFTPYTHALAAAVDMLEKKTNPEDTRNACIILITDGVLDDREFYHPDKPYDVSEEAARLQTEASQKAGSHDWPIYSIQLNYGNANTKESELAAKRLAEISANGGKNNVGCVACEDDNSVFAALMAIFSDFMRHAPVPPTVITLPDSVYFNVEPLTSEASIDIFGEGITGVSLYQVDSNNKRIKEYKTNITVDIEQKDLMVTASEGYYSIKMICPDAGRWEVYVEGTGGVEVLVSSSSLREMRLSMDAHPITEENPLTKNNTITVNAAFTYHGMVEDNNSIYMDMPAELKVFGANDRTIYTIDQDNTDCYSADKTGYHFMLPLNLFPNEKVVKVQVVVEDGMFRDGIKRSELAAFSFEDLATSLLETAGEKNMEAHVGESVQLDMREIFSNPDGDPLTYVLSCVNDAAITFEHTIENDQMNIMAGRKPGEYQIAIDVAGEKATYRGLTLSVVNEYPYLKSKIKNVELWSDCYSFQNIEDVDNTVDLNAHFKDAEQMPLSYTIKTSKDGVVEINEENGIMTINTIEGIEDNVEVTVTATDGITKDSVATDSFRVAVVSGKMVFWRQNWIYFAISGAILLAIIILILVLIKNKLVKGEWQISVDDCGETEYISNAVDIAGFLSVGRKRKFKLMDLMNELAVFLPGGWGMKIANYFSEADADKLTLVGVTRRKGCDVTGVPKNNPYIRVNINGVDVAKGKGKLHNGTLTVIIEKNDGSGDRMTISMTLM